MPKTNHRIEAYDAVDGTVELELYAHDESNPRITVAGEAILCRGPAATDVEGYDRSQVTIIARDRSAPTVALHHLASAIVEAYGEASPEVATHQRLRTQILAGDFSTPIIAAYAEKSRASRLAANPWGPSIPTIPPRLSLRRPSARGWTSSRTTGPPRASRS